PRCDGPEGGRLRGNASAVEPGPAGDTAGDGLAMAITAACDEAGVSPAEIDLVVSAAPPPLASLEARAVAAALGARRPRLIMPKRSFGETLGAAGVLGLLAAVADAEGGDVVLALDVCPSGHVAALVASVPEVR